MMDRGDAAARHMVAAEALLELAASGYERAQRDRLRYGEQLRAILQRRDVRWGSVDEDPDGDPDALLREIRATGGGPVPILGRLYSNAWDQEREMGGQMQALIARHPAWPFLHGVRGIGSVLAARLLSRLDIARAPSPASFWAYCGLGTVAAEELVCDRCGARVFVAPGTRVVAPHAPAGRRGSCAESAPHTICRRRRSAISSACRSCAAAVRTARCTMSARHTSRRRTPSGRPSGYTSLRCARR